MKNICLTGLENAWKHDASGKMCVNRNDFMEVTGYDENFDGYGFEDFDIVNRLRKGCETFTINVRLSPGNFPSAMIAE